MKIRNTLSACSEPWLWRTSSSLPSDILDKSIILDAEKMTSLDGLYDEFAEQLNFPDYFGRNYNALSEMMADLSWLSRDSYIVVIKNANLLLSNEEANILSGLLEILNTVAKEWSISIEQGEEWDRASVPFHVVFQTPPEFQESFAKRIADIDFSIADLSLPESPTSS